MLEHFSASSLLGGDSGALAAALNWAIPSFVSDVGTGGRGAEAREARPLSGLVSFCNKSEADSGPVFVPDFANRIKRVRRMTRGVIHTARVMSESLRSRGIAYRSAFITLTYAPEVKWSPLHIAMLLDHYRKWCLRRRVEFRYVWVMELTQAGRPHYHIVAFLPPGITPPLPDKQGWWPHGKTQAKWARSPVGYLAKYASKGSDGRGELPKGARLWGSGGVSRELRPALRWALAPSWVRFLSGDPSEPVRKRVAAKDGDSWWEFPTRGIVCGSPWEFNSVAGIVRWKGWTAWDVAFFDPVNSCEV